MRRARARHRPLAAPTVNARARGPLDVPGRGLERPARPPGGTTPRSRSRPGMDIELVSRRAPGCSSGPPAGVPSERRPRQAVWRRRRRAARRRAAPRRPARARRSRPRCAARRSTRHPLRELVTSLATSPLRVERERALYGSWYEFFPRSEGAVSTEDGGRRSGTFAHRRRAAARPSRRWASTSSTCRRSTRSAPPSARAPTTPSTAGPDDPGVAVGDRLGRGRPRRDPPRPGHARGLRRLRGRGRASWAWRSRSTSRCSARPTTRGSPSTPSGSTTAPTAPIAYAENPPKKYQDIYPINFDNDPDGHLRRGAADRAALDGPRRADLPGRQPAHQAGRLLGAADRATSTATDPDVIFLAEAFTRPRDDAHAGQDRLPAVVHVLHLAQRQGGARAST